MTGKVETHYRACNLCEAICGLELKVAEGEPIIRRDASTPMPAIPRADAPAR